MSELKETDLQVFVHAVQQYFASVSSDRAEIEAAYLADRARPEAECIGLITCSGQFEGCVYCGGSQRMLRELLQAFGETDLREANLLDAIGEISNTIAGNARRHFGPGLVISTPVAITGGANEVHSRNRARPFAITVRWRNNSIIVVIDLVRATEETKAH